MNRLHPATQELNPFSPLHLAEAAQTLRH
jgi:hypothetical protein